MKKYILTLLAFVFIFQLSQAQIGLKLGANYASISIDGDDPDIDFGPRLSYQIGVFGDFDLTPGLALRPGLIYNSKGNKISFPNSTEEFKNTLNYLDIPINLAFKFKPAGTGFVVEAGPYIGIYLSGDSDGQDIDDDQIDNTNFGINANVSFEVRNLGVGLGYARGLGSFNKEDGVLTIQGKHSVFTLFGVILF